MFYRYFPRSDFGSAFSLTASNVESGSHVYAVMPAKAGVPGRVLGVIPIKKDSSASYTLVSDVQRELLNDVLGFSTGSSAACGSRLSEEADSSKSAAYCVKGASRNTFVPLANELTSDSNGSETSWRHYLTLAKQAAARADELGQKLIDIGLQQDFRREGAGEAVGAICGDYGALDKIKYDGGAISSKTNSTIAACINEPRLPVVFFSAAKLKADALEILGCSGTPPPAKCTALTDCPDPLVGGPGCDPTVPGIDIVADTGDGATEKSDPTTRCSQIVNAAKSISTGFDSGGVGAGLVASWASRDALRTTASMITVHVDEALEWSVDSIGKRIMSSDPASGLWPGCLRSGTGLGGTVACLGGPTSSAGSAEYAEVAKRLSRIFLRRDDLTQDLDSTDTRILLWRVEGALWTMGTFGGVVPSGLFHVRLPVASFSGTTDIRTQAPIVTVYGRGEFQEVPVGSGQYKLDSRSDDEIRERLGVVKTGVFPPWPTTSTSFTSQAEIPSWLRGPSGGTSGYLLVETLNDSYGPTTISDFKVEGSPIDGTQFSNAVGTYVRALAGVQCGSHFDGEPTAGALPSQWADANKALAIWKTKSWSTTRAGASYAYGTDAPMELITVDYLSSNLLRTVMGPGTVAYDDITYLTNASQHVPGGYHQTSYWGPKRNAQWFVNSYPPAGTCGTASQLASTLALACVLSSGEIHTGDLSKPPIIDSLDKLGLFQRWLGGQGKLVRKNLSRMYLEDVPKRVVNAFVSKTPLDASAGEHGIQLTKLQGQLSQGARIADSIASDIDQLSLAFDAANIQIQLANVDLSIEAKELAIRRVQAQAHIAAVLAQAASFTVVDAFGSKEYVEAADAVVQVGAELDVLGKMDDIEQLKKQKNALQIAAALNELNTAASRLFGNIRENLSNFRTQAADLRAILLELKSTESKAAYEAAKGSGEDFVRSSTGEVLATYPVNTVLRRQYDATDIRYKRALNDAKYLAYLARLSIEQRFGVRLSSITTPVGALDAPSKWVDDVCSLTGVKYGAYRAADMDAGAHSAADNKVIGEFADAFIGDYITKLENFVEFFNLDYPSHEGDDVAVISLKQDLLGKDAVCTTESPNLLYHSGDLGGYHGVSEGGVGVTKGWIKTTCGATDPKCLQKLPASSLSGGSLASPASVNPGDEISWLRDVAAASSDAGAPIEAGVPVSPDSTPKYAVWQRVRLAPGSYVLSFWDQARTATGALVTVGDAGATAPPYRVALLDSSFGIVAQQDIAPHEGDGWSERRLLRVNVKALGDYEVVFWAAADPGKFGSVAIAGTQLEWSPTPVGEPSAYVATTSTREILSTECGEKSKDIVQKAFARRCDADGHCWYELVKPVWIDTVGLDAATSRLRGKLAAGNYNYRHVDIALNLVGTGVRDCSKAPTSDCYGSGYVEYDLIHDAFQTSVLGWDGNTECFNFGSGVINHGKALAAERYITVPFGSADQSLISQPSILKEEFRGRPLDGDYKLRIYDSPALAWDKLEDVQLVLKYRYWSAVRAKP